MVCPRCNHSFSNPVPMDDSSGECPRCGAICMQSSAGILKTSTILISANRTDAVYRSVEDVPEPLRKMLLQSTSGLNSGTILIADRRGKEHISKAIQSLPASTQQKLKESVLGGALEARAGALPNRLSLRWPLRYWLGLLIVSAAGLVAWVVTTYNW